MKKKIVSILLCAMMGLSITACGQGKTESGSSAASAAESVVSESAVGTLEEEIADMAEITATEIDGIAILDKEDYTLDECITLGEYKGLAFTKEVKPVTDADVLIKISQLTGNQGEELTDADATVQMGDTAVIDYEGKKDGVPFDGGTSQEPYGLQIGSGSFIPGFEEGVVGMKAGETKDITLSFPENYPAADLAGQEVVFTVKLHSIKRLTIDDAWVKENAGSDYANAEEYIESNRKVLEEQNAQNAENKLYSDVWNTVRDNCTFKAFPKTMVQEASTSYVQNAAQQADMYGMKLADMVETYGKDQFDKDKLAYAGSAVKDKLFLEAYMKAEGIEKDGEEYQKGLADIVADAGAESADELIQAYGKDPIDEMVLRTVVVEHILSSANVTEA